VIAGRGVGMLGLHPTGLRADRPAGTHRVLNASLQVACIDQWIDVGYVFVDGMTLRGDRVADWIRARSTAEHPRAPANI
jgi:hypothetical protein